MPTIQKFYLHDAASIVVGTLPGAGTLSTTRTATFTASGAATNRVMDGSIGAGPQVDAPSPTFPLNSGGNDYWCRRFVSPPLAAQVIAGGNWTVGAAMNWFTGGGAMDADPIGGTLVIWRPSTGTIVATLFDVATPLPFGTTPTITEAGIVGGGTSFTCSGATLQDGDVLVWELWNFHDNTAASFFVAGTLHDFYDGTVDPIDGTSTTNPASYLLAPAAISLATPPPISYAYALE